MSAQTTQQTRQSTWHSTATAISTSISTIRTDSMSVRAVTLPMPTLNLAFGGAGNGDFTLTRAMPRRSPVARLAEPALREQKSDIPKQSNRIEMTIDSLPNHILVEPIPVAIDAVEDAAFTAWVPNLDTNATGHSVVEALLLLKDRIESVYDDLNKCSQLTAEQKTMLQLLHTYIAPQKPEWQY
ncbi:MAG TPA: hypothetical protein VM782_09080 [Stellaceae bacterium]|nr:hypothetical protein [Stellaceae bacterium]